jgi:hypothetical protein
VTEEKSKSDNYTGPTSNRDRETKHDPLFGAGAAKQPSNIEEDESPIDQLTKEEIAQFRLLLKEQGLKQPTAEKSSERVKEEIPRWRTTNTATGFGRGFRNEQTKQLTDEEISQIRVILRTHDKKLFKEMASAEEGVTFKQYSTFKYSPKDRQIGWVIIIIVIIFGIFFIMAECQRVK